MSAIKPDELKRDINRFNIAKTAISSIPLKKEEVKRAFITLEKLCPFKIEEDKNRYPLYDFKPTTVAKQIKIIKDNRQSFKSTGNESWIESIEDFYSLCEKYYAKSEDYFYEFQICLRNQEKSWMLTPLDNAVLQKLYTDSVRPFPPETSIKSFDDLHNKKQQCFSLFEKFGFTDVLTDKFLKKCTHTAIYNAAKSEKEFDMPIFDNWKLEGKWEDYKKFKDVCFKDEPIYKDYCNYCKFLQCKQVLITIQLRNNSVSRDFYVNIKKQLSEIIDSDEKSQNLIERFCYLKEINLKCDPIDARRIEELKQRAFIIKKMIINDILTPLNTILSDTITSWNELQKKISIANIDSKLKDLSERKGHLDSDADNEDKGNLEKLQKYIDEFKIIKSKINDLQSSCKSIKDFIENKVDDADNNIKDTYIFNEYTAADVYEELYQLLKKVKEKLDKFNEKKTNCINQIDEIDDKKKEFEETERKMWTKINKKTRQLDEAINKHKKPITRYYIWSQITLCVGSIFVLLLNIKLTPFILLLVSIVLFYMCYRVWRRILKMKNLLVSILLLIVFFSICTPLYVSNKSGFVFFSINLVVFICYVVYLSWLFDGYNKAVYEKSNSVKEKKVQSYDKDILKLIIKIIGGIFFEKKDDIYYNYFSDIINNKIPDYDNKLKPIVEVIVAGIFFVIVQSCFLIVDSISSSSLENIINKIL